MPPIKSTAIKAMAHQGKAADGECSLTSGAGGAGGSAASSRRAGIISVFVARHTAQVKVVSPCAAVVGSLVILPSSH